MDCITVEVIRKPNEPWGIQVSGEAPCYIDNVKKDSPADEAGMQKGDCIFSVNGVNVHDSTHDHVVQLIADSGRMARFKVLPSVNEQQSVPKTTTVTKDVFWTNEDPSELKKITTNSSLASELDKQNEDEFDHTDYQTFCELLESAGNSMPKQKEVKHTDHLPKKEKRTKKNKKKSIKTEKIENEQDNFIVSREDQRDFDENYSLECTFKGKKATVAGAFTGDHNQIVGQTNDDVRGIRARVMAGIQHFSFEDEQEKINAEDKGKIIVYTTGLGIHRGVAQSCEQVRKIFKGYRVKFEDRDIFNSSEHKDELYTRLGLMDGAPFPEMPRVYLDGVYVGGAEEVQAMSDCGDLRIRLKEFPKYNIRSKCPTCNATGAVVCHSCKGKAFRKKNRFALLKCGTCHQKGSLCCPDCL